MTNLLGLEVQGTAMEPTIFEGDTVWVDPNQMPRSNGKDIAALIVNDEKFICKFTRYGSQYILMFEDAPITVVRIEEVEMLGKVVGYGVGTQKKENHSAANTMAFNL